MFRYNYYMKYFLSSFLLFLFLVSPALADHCHDLTNQGLCEQQEHCYWISASSTCETVLLTDDVTVEFYRSTLKEQQSTNTLLIFILACVSFLVIYGYAMKPKKR